MKRIVCFTLSLLLVACLCGCGSNLPSGTKENLQMIVNHVESTGAMIQSTQAVIDWQIESSVAEMERTQAARDNGEIYEVEDNIEEIRGKYQELTGLHEELITLKSEIDSLPSSTGIQQLDFSRESLFRVLESRYGVRIYKACRTMEARIIDPADADLLQVKRRSAASIITSVGSVEISTAMCSCPG